MAEKDIILEEKTTEEKTTEETKEEVKEETPLEDVVLETEGGTKSLLGATSGTDIAATSLDTKTTPAGTDNLILFNQNTNVGYQIDYDNLADAILDKITSKTYANQVGGSSAATLLAQLSTLNSNWKYRAGSVNFTANLTANTWATHLGPITSGRLPSGENVNGGYNMRNMPKGTWLFIACVNIKTNDTGVKGFRLYVNENQAGEKIMCGIPHAGGYYVMTWVADLTETSNSARLGAFSNTAGEIRANLTAIQLY